jgi:hypothetical protein
MDKSQRNVYSVKKHKKLMTAGVASGKCKKAEVFIWYFCNIGGLFCLFAVGLDFFSTTEFYFCTFKSQLI